MKKFLNILSDLLIIILVVLVGAVLVIKFALGWELKAVLTPSMEPELPVGSLLIIKPVEFEEINIGDDVTVVRDSSLTLVTHRVIEKDENSRQITTQGIANDSPDSPSDYANVVGKVIYHIPLVGYFVIWLSTLKGKIICGIIIAAALTLSLIISDEPKNKKKLENNGS